MRRIVLTVTLVLWVSHLEAAILFTPDSFTLSVNPVFNDTGTDTFCWQCGDANPLNDLQAVLDFSDLSADWRPFVAYAGLLLLQSTTTNYLGLDATFSLRATLTASGASLPESVVSPSVSFGIIPGRLLGVEGGTAVVLECCDGSVGGVEFRQAFFPSTPFTVPPGELVETLVALELHLPQQIEYTPVAAVPEPTSLLLFGPALAAAALRRRREKTQRALR